MMKRRGTIRIAALAGVVALAAACGAGGNGEGGDTAMPAGVDHVNHESMSMGAPTDHSIYNLNSVWVDQHGDERRLASLGGRAQVVAMVYTNCTFACPRLLADMKRIEARIDPEHLGDVGFVLISIDPDRDTPERLREFATGARLDPERWTLLHGGEFEIREVAALLGVKYRRTSETDFAHSNVITVLNPAGEVVHRQTGFGSDPVESLAAIRRAIGGAPGGNAGG